MKIVLSITRINQWGTGDNKLKMINENSINIIYTEKIGIQKKFGENDEQLTELKEKICDNNNLIRNNFTSILSLKTNYVIDNIWLFDLNFDKDINFKSNIDKFLVYENNIIYDFKIGSIIQLDESIVYLHDSLRHFYYILKESYQFLDQNDTILTEFDFNTVTKGVTYRNLQIYKNTHYHKIVSMIKKLIIKLYLQCINETNDLEFNLKLSHDFQNNHICLKYLKYTS